MLTTILISLSAFILGGGTVLVFSLLQRQSEKKVARSKAKEILDEAAREAEKLLTETELQGKEKLLQLEQEQDRLWRSRQDEVERLRTDLDARGQKLDKALRHTRDQLNQLNQREKALQQQEEEAGETMRAAREMQKAQQSKLEEIANMTPAEAKQELMRQFEFDARRESTRIVRRIEQNARDRAKKLARIILIQAIEKVTPHLPLEGLVTVVRLPNEEMKGRVIGREGRNIRTFERITGVDVIVDDTPEIIMLACHNPMRREIAKLALEKLVEDGRIHPARIEEFNEKAREQIEETLFEQGKEALFQLGIYNMHDYLITMVGRMRLRTALGQNLLEHSMETAKIATFIGQAVDVNVDTIKRAGILHEIGHLDEQFGETHPVLLAAQIAKQYGEPQAVVDCIAHLHPDHPSTAPEAHILESAEHLSLAIPGIHREGLEKYVEHLEAIERMVMEFKGVQKAYAVKAGRELLVFLDPGQADDEYTVWLAKDVAERLERETQFAGQIKVQVVRESRHIAYAK